MKHHDHDQHSHSEHAAEPPMAFDQKAHKLLAHWIHHNQDHATTYRQWAQEFTRNNMADVAGLLESAADATSQINLTLEQALRRLESKE